MNSAAADLLPAHRLERLGSLDVIARRLVAGFVAGQHRSVHRGAGEEFHRHRPYQQGDDSRHIDWRLFGRTDRLYVREYREISNLRAYLLIDASASMAYAGADGLSKLRYGVYLAAALAHLMLRSGDAVGLAAAGSEAALLSPPRTRRGQIHELLLALERLHAGGTPSVAATLDRVASALPRRGRVILISDLLEEDEGRGVLSAIGRLRARDDEVMVLRVLTPEELGEAAPGSGLYFDPERPTHPVPASPDRDAGYRARVEAYYRALADRLQERGAEYVPLRTDRPVEEGLSAWIRGRR